MARCSRCKRKGKVRKVYSFVLCEECWKGSSDMTKGQYPTYKSDSTKAQSKQEKEVSNARRET